MKLATIRFSLILLFPLLNSALAQQPLNLDFEKKSVEGIARPWGWSPFRLDPGTKTLLDSTSVYEGKYSLCFSNGNAQDKGKEGDHVLAYWLSPHDLRGSSVVLMGWIKLEKSAGFAQLSMAAYGDTGLIKEIRSPEFKGVAGWRLVKIDFNTSTPAHSWFITLETNGSGKVWFDDFRLIVNGVEKTKLEVSDDFTPAQRLWIKKNSSPLNTFRPDSIKGKTDYPDLKAFRKAVGAAGIIALGEATHGTSEFFQLKHRLLQFAVQELNVQVFAIEANQLEVEKINRYVCDGVGSANNVIKVMFRVWNTEEMLALIEWMRAYNLQNPTQKVSFEGFDLQDPSLAMDSISQFISGTQPEWKLLIDSLQQTYREAWRKQYYPQAPDSIRGIWKANATRVLELMNAKNVAWLSKAKSAAERNRVEWALQNARVVYQAADVAFSQIISRRDTFMAENIRWIKSRQAPGTRMIVWAHDSHIARGDHPDARYNYHGGESMGRYLSKMFGKDYRAFGLFTGSGQYSATVSFSNHKVLPVDASDAPKGSFDEALHQIATGAGTDVMFLNLQPAQRLKNNAWLKQPRPVRFVSYAASDFDFGALMSVPDQFDGLFFIDKTNASKMLR